MLYIILTRFPKLLLIITKRYSSVALHFLRHLFPFWSASVQKKKQNHRSLRDLGDVATSTAPSLDGEKGRVAGEDTSVESVTVLSLAGHTAAGRGLTPMPQSSASSLRSTVAVSVGDSSANLVGPNVPHFPPE